MKYLRQFFILLYFSFLGEALHAFLPLPVPGSIYGLVLLFLALLTGVVKLEQVGRPAGLMMWIMPVLFVPAGVGLMDSWGSLKSMLLPAVVIVAVSTVLVMAAAGRITQWTMGRSGGKKRKKECGGNA